MLLYTRRLLLRPIGPQDLSAVHAYTGDAETTKYMLLMSKRTPQETLEFLQEAQAQWRKPSPDYYEFAIEHNHRLIGSISLYLDGGHQEGELGWVLHKHHQGFGFATEAAQAVIQFAKETLHLRRLIAQCDWRNTASLRVMEKLGMTLTDDNGQRTYQSRGETARELTYTLVLSLSQANASPSLQEDSL